MCLKTNLFGNLAVFDCDTHTCMDLIVCGSIVKSFFRSLRVNCSASFASFHIKSPERLSNCRSASDGGSFFLTATQRRSRRRHSNFCLHRRLWQWAEDSDSLQRFVSKSCRPTTRLTLSSNRCATSLRMSPSGWDPSRCDFHRHL